MANKPGEANFFPNVPTYPEIGTFQPIYGKFDLTTYIQGASDYEIMAFLVGKYNATLEAYGTVTKLSTETIEAAHQLQDWINNWFDNLNVQQELNNKIDSMVADGSFGTLLHQTFDTQINQQTTNAVTAWLVANVTPTGSAVVVDKSLSIEGAAADAKEVGDTTFRTDINVYNAYTASAPYDNLNTLPANKTVMYSYNTGIKNYPGSDLGICQTISQNKTGTTSFNYGLQIFTSFGGAIYTRFCFNATWSNWSPIEKGVINIADGSQATAPYDNANTFPGNSHILCSYIGGIANIPDTPGLCVTHSLGINPGAGSIQIYSGTNNIVYVRTKNAVDEWGVWSPINITADITPPTLYSSFTQFPKIGVIGDSYASGEIYINNQGNDYYELSWLQCVARTCGITGTNFSSGGLSTRSWLTAPKGLSLVNSSDAQNLYIFALGINDYYALGESYLGSPDDIKDDYHDNPDTFYGNYAKIIEQVKAKAPNAKMLMLTTANTNETPMKFNNAIEYIANHYNIPFARQYEYDFFKSNYYKNMVGGHPTAMVYSGMAEAFKQIFSDVCIKYQSYFNDYVG